MRKWNKIVIKDWKKKRKFFIFHFLCYYIQPIIMFQYINTVTCVNGGGVSGPMTGHPTTVHQPTVTQKDTTLTKIFVGGLPYHTTDKSLKKFFESFGDIEEAVVITDRQTGKSRGYGFVSFICFSFFCL